MGENDFHRTAGFLSADISYIPTYLRSDNCKSCKGSFQVYNLVDMDRTHSHSLVPLGFSESIWGDTGKLIRCSLHCYLSLPFATAWLNNVGTRNAVCVASFDSHPIEMELCRPVWSAHVSSTCLLCSQRIHQNYIYSIYKAMEEKSNIGFLFHFSRRFLWFRRDGRIIDLLLLMSRFRLPRKGAFAFVRDLVSSGFVVTFRIDHRTKWNCWIDESLSEEERTD